MSDHDRSQTRSGPSALDTALLFRVAENAPIAIAVVEGPQHRFIYANTPYRELNPALGTGIIGRRMCEIFPDVDTEGIALTDQIACEAEESLRILDGLIRCIPEGLAIADAKDVSVLSISEFGRKMTGRSREKLVGRMAAGSQSCAMPRRSKTAPAPSPEASAAMPCWGSSA